MFTVVHGTEALPAGCVEVMAVKIGCVVINLITIIMIAKSIAHRCCLK